MYLRIVMLLAMGVFGSSAHAEDAMPSDSMIVDIIMVAMQAASVKIVAQAIQWMSLFMLLQMLITNLGVLKAGGELDSLFAKFLGSVMWFGFCWYVLSEGPDFISRVGTQFINEFAPNLPSATSILLTAVGTATGLFVVAAAVGVASSITGQMLLYVILGILLIGLFFAGKLILLQLELGITVMLAPFNFAFLALNALKDQGIAPFKSLLSLMYRIVLYGILFGAYSHVGNAMGTLAAKYSGGDPIAMIASGWQLVKLLFAGLAALAVLAFLLYKSDSIAASLASGSTNLGTGDVAGAAMAGAAAGALMGSGAAAVTSSRPVQGMSDWLKQDATGAGGASISNAAMEGAGGLGTALLKPEVPNMSMSDKGTATGSGTGPQAGSSSNKSGSAAPQTSNGRANAAGAVSKAGGSPQATKAAGDAAAAGKSSADISAAAWGAGGTPAQGTAAAVAEALGSAGAGEQTIAAGVEAAAAGGSPEQIASAVEQAAVGDTGMSGQDPGQFANTAASAASASRLPGVGTSQGLQRDPERDAAREARREATLAKKAGRSGASAGIGGGSTMEQKLGDLVDAMNNPKERTFADRVGELNQHIAQEGAATIVSINTHQE